MIDYYKVLEIKPGATIEQIKRAYRRLALKYHPDVSDNSKHATAQFNLIKEAYETLTEPLSREKYMSERWRTQAYAEAFDNEVITPEDVLQSVLHFYKKSLNLDEYRLDKSGLLNELKSILNNDKQQILNEFQDIKVNDEVIAIAIKSSSLLALNHQLDLLNHIATINHSDKVATDIKEKELRLQESIRWEKTKPYIFLLIVLTLCFIIWVTNIKTN